MFDEDAKVVSKSKRLLAGFCPWSVCVIGDVIFFVGVRNGVRWWLCRVDAIDDLVKEKDLNCIYQYDASAMTSSGGDLYVLFDFQLLIARGGDLESAKVICHFTVKFDWPNISVQGHKLALFCLYGHVTLDLTTLNTTVPIKNSPDDLRYLPVEGSVFASCQFKEGLVVALAPEDCKKGVQLCWFQLSTNAEEAMASFKSLGELPVNPFVTFDLEGYCFRWSLIY